MSSQNNMNYSFLFNMKDFQKHNVEGGKDSQKNKYT